MIKLGSNNIGKIYLGSNSIGKAYLGSNLVFQKGGSHTSGRLPAGFSELQYVSTDSRAKINTGVAGASDLEVFVRFSVETYIQYGWVYGNYIDESHNANRCLLGSESALIVGGGNNLSTSLTGFSVGTIQNVTVKSDSAYRNVTKATITASSLTSNTDNICLGYSNTSSTNVRDIGLKIYAFSIKKNGTPVLDYVPCKRDSDDATGFYDMVSDSFVKSLTGTEFVAGPVIPYAHANYIVTDGNCYIMPGNSFSATPPKSCEMKVKMPTNFTSSTVFSLLAGYLPSSGSDSKAFALARYYNQTIAFTYYGTYGSGDGMPSITYSLDNDKPFIIKNDIKKGEQHVNIKQENSDSWTTVTKSNNNTVSSGYQFAIFGAYRNGGYEDFSPNGTRLYYCKIYSDETYSHPLFDGIPCLYNGEYGLWDKVSDTFKGNANATGAFSGPSNA